MAKRYDSRHRLLRTGESERVDGYYTYRWTSRSGKRNSVTAGTLEELREKEDEIQRDVSDGIRADAKNVTLNSLYDLWKELKVISSIIRFQITVICMTSLLLITLECCRLQS